jgi:hypothetical protein
MMVVAMTLLATAVFFGVTTTSKAQKQAYHGYVLGGKLPSKAECLHYQKTHGGVERWRLWVRMYAYKQVRYHIHGAKNWQRVWNEEWVLQTMKGESGGQQHPNNSTYRGLMQIWKGHVPYRLQNMLYVGWFNLKKAASMFAAPGYYGGPQPWDGGPPVYASPYAHRS